MVITARWGKATGSSRGQGGQGGFEEAAKPRTVPQPRVVCAKRPQCQRAQMLRTEKGKVQLQIQTGVEIAMSCVELCPPKVLFKS